jgi:hypothetical protein
MVDWKDLAQRQITKIQRALPEPIRARATEVPVFFSPARDEKSFAYLGVFEGYSLIEGHQINLMKCRGSLSFRYAGSSSELPKDRVSPRGSDYLSPRIGNITLGGMKDRLPMSAWREVSSAREEPRQPNHRFWDAPLRQSFKIRHRTRQIRSSDGIPAD